MYRYIAVKSAFEVNKPDKIYFYYYYEPFGHWWNLTKEIITLVKLEEKDIPNEIYGNKNILVTPQSGDTLHFFPPGSEFYKYNLPPHQDYQYLMQSPSQITFYMGLSKYKDDVGGLRIWEKSHKLGILPTTTNEFGSFEVKR
jgi:hypothetical protein